MKTLKIFLRGLFFFANIVALILFVLAAYSDQYSPVDSHTMAYLGLAFPIFCFANFCFLICWLFMKRWRYVIIGIIAFIICWGPITRYFPFHSKTDPVPQENTIKVLSYNVMNFALKRHTPLSPNKIIQYIAESDADIVCLQEYMTYKNERGMSKEVIFEALDMYPYKSVIVLNDVPYRTSGLAVFSKYPITKSRKLAYNSKYNGSSIHEISINNKKLILVNNHLESFGLTAQDRSQYSNLIKSMDSEALEGIRETFQQKLGPAFIKRAQQAEMIAEEIQKAKGDYYLVCGDFNDTPISYAHRTIQGDLLDAFEESGMGMGVTYNQSVFRFRIDNILHSSNIKSYNCTIDKVNYSDHYPIWSYLQLEE